MIISNKYMKFQTLFRVGEHNMRAREGSEVDYQVARVIRHRQYNPRSLDFDIAILKLSRPIQMNRYVQPVCLASRELRSGGNCYITGMYLPVPNKKMGLK